MLIKPCLNNLNLVFLLILCKKLVQPYYRHVKFNYYFTNQQYLISGMDRAIEQSKQTRTHLINQTN